MGAIKKVLAAGYVLRVAMYLVERSCGRGTACASAGTRGRGGPRACLAGG